MQWTESMSRCVEEVNVQEQEKGVREFNEIINAWQQDKGFGEWKTLLHMDQTKVFVREFN